MAQIISVADFKAAEGINRPDSDAQITTIVNGVNSYLSDILDLDNTSDYLEKVETTESFFLDTLDRAADIIVTDVDGVPLTGLTGSRGRYTLTNDYVGIVNFTYSNHIPLTGGTYPADIILAAHTLARYYKREEYKASASAAGQSISFVTLSSNIPKHILSLVAHYRPL